MHGDRARGRSGHVKGGLAVRVAGDLGGSRKRSLPEHAEVLSLVNEGTRGESRQRVGIDINNIATHLELVPRRARCSTRA